MNFVAIGLLVVLGLDEGRQQVEGQENQRDHPRKRGVIPSPVHCGRGFRYTQPSAGIALSETDVFSAGSSLSNSQMPLGNS